MRGKVLVLGDDTRSFLAIVRSLGRKGVAVDAAPFDFRAPALKSRFLRRVHALPYHLGDGAAWLEAMRALLGAEGYGLVIPCDERALLPLDAHRDELAPLARLAIPERPALDMLFDKHETRELARRLGIPIAPGRLLGEGEDAAALAAEFGLPLAVKPRRSYRPEAPYQRQAVRMVTGNTALAEALAVCGPGTHLAEGFVPGTGIGLSVLAQGGRVLYAFQHRRVREDASGAYYRVSEPPAPELAEAAGAMMSALSHTGIAMVEFRCDGKGGWALLEINARPWGSLPLAVAAGADFPWFWYRLLVEGEAPRPRPYRTGLYGRNLVPDLHALAAEGRPWKALAALPRLFAGRESWDALTADDARPGLAELGHLAAGRAARLVPAALVRLSARAAFRRALRRAEGVPTIAVVCLGNVCRSPFAAQALERHLGEAAKRVRIVSAGMLPRPGRPPPPEAIAAAAKLCYDIAAHRSAHFGPDLARAATIVLAFDDRTVEAVRSRHPELPAPVLRLGALGDGPLEVPDPWGSDTAGFLASYERVEAMCREAAAIMGGLGR